MFALWLIVLLLEANFHVSLVHRSARCLTSSVRGRLLSLRCGRMNDRSSRSTTLRSSNDDSVEPVEDSFNAPVGPLPSVSSRINWDETPKNINCDLWVAGAGTLGSFAAKQWKEMHGPDSVVVAETKTTARHDALIAAGIKPRLREQRSVDDEVCARNLIIAIPPSVCKSGEYSIEVADACRIWAGPLGGGNLIFTSSISVYGDSIGNTVNEKFRVDTRSKRSTQMLDAEQQVLGRGGCVVRLAGLYLSDRGPHTFWLRNGTVDAPATGTLNMLHYEDAAGVAVAAAIKGR